MITFFADLDNTLIYSHRREIRGEKFAVEWLHDREQSYMTKKTYEYLLSAKNINAVPLTSRTIEQYSRLSGISEKLGWRYALVCNGGILLKDGKICTKWLDETYGLAENAESELKRSAELLRAENKVIHETEKIMVYAGVEEPQKVEMKLKSELDTELLHIYSDNRKVYCLPKEINKGNAVKRFLKCGLACGFTAAAGDGEQDISMLESVETAIVPEFLAERVNNRSLYKPECDEVFSDGICRILDELNIAPS